MTVPVHVPALVVIGGAEAGTFAVRQILRARAAGRLEVEHVRVVDRDPGCAARAFLAESPLVRLDVADWSEWLDGNLDEISPDAHLVPYHWAPHLFFEWLVRQARRAGLEARKGPPPPPPPGVPFERATRDADRALSYATWTCPATCIEPALCPHTRQARDWSLCGDLEGAGREGADPGAGAESTPLAFRCLHLVYGVGTVPLRSLLEARARLLSSPREGATSFVVATSSHCHALAARLEVEGRIPASLP